MVKENVITSLYELAAKIRRDVVLMIGGDGQTGHLGGSCSSAEILAVLYGYKMRFNPKDPDWPERDKFLFSKGHAAIGQYAVMAEMGYFPVEELTTVKKLKSRLQGHPDKLKTPGIEANTGSLGQGLSIANGLALAMRLDGRDNRVYCIMGDGEMNEGQIWEAAMAAANFKIDNIVGIVDKNNLQATGICSERFNTGPLASKWESFGWHVREIDGHRVEEIIDALSEADGIKGKPSIIIAHTVKGKGFSFAENVASFHNGSLTREQYDLALKEINEQILALSGK